MSERFEVSPEELKIFLEEADELLQGMEEGILRLEREPVDAECLRELFRQAHTLKGSAATLGHREMAQVAHRMESSLEPLRRGQGTVSGDLTDALLAALDALKAFRDSIAGGAVRPVSVPEVLARLEAAAGPGEEPLPAAAAGAAPLPELGEEEQAAIRQAVETGEGAWWVTVPVDSKAPMPSVRAYQVLMQLGQMGTVVRSWPTEAELEKDGMEEELRVLLVTPRTEAKIRAGAAAVPETGPVRMVRAEAVSGNGGGGAGGGSGGTPSPAEAPGRAGAAGGRTVRVDVEVLDALMNLVGELVIDRTRLQQVLNALGGAGAAGEAARDLAQASAHIGRVTGDLQDQIMRARMLPVESLFRKFPRMIRDLAQNLGKEVELVVEGEETELDRAVMEEIADPIMHLLRNALDHGIELPLERVKVHKQPQGTVHLTARHEEDRIVLSIRDDGRGLDPVKLREAAVRKGMLTAEAARRLPDQEAINLVFAPGFSTQEQVTDISGRGVGMDVVKQNLDKLNGTVEVWSEVGKGTEFRLKIPLTLAILRGLMVQMLGEVYAMPLTSVVEIVDLTSQRAQTVRGQPVITFRGQVVPLVTAAEAFALPKRTEVERRVAVLVQAFGQQIGLAVDGLLGEQEVVVKPLGHFVGEVPGISGATILGDGDVALILDVPRLVGVIGRHQMSA